MRRYTIPISMKVEFLLGDHLGSTSLTVDSTGVKTSEIKYKPWGEIRSAWVKPDINATPTYRLTDYTFTGQRSYMDDPTTTGATEGFGLMFYNARWYDPQLGRFAQADTIVPQQTQGTQAWDRYAYTNNNPVKYTDPSGHRVDDGCRGDNGCSISAYQKQRDTQKSAMLEKEAHQRRCESGNYNYCSTAELIYKRHSKPVSGVHIGYSGQAGYWLEPGAYTQWDFLVDWKEGNLYVVQAAGGFAYVGTPSALIGEVYVGTSVVHGVPGDVQDISDLLAGPQVDGSAEIGIDAFGEIGYVRGLSVDLDSNKTPYHTLGAGYMYTTENSIEFGLNLVPNILESGVEFGASESFVIMVIPLY